MSQRPVFALQRDPCGLHPRCPDRCYRRALGGFAPGHMPPAARSSGTGEEVSTSSCQLQQGLGSELTSPRMRAAGECVPSWAGETGMRAVAPHILQPSPLQFPCLLAMHCSGAAQRQSSAFLWEAEDLQEMAPWATADTSRVRVASLGAELTDWHSKCFRELIRSG